MNKGSSFLATALFASSTVFAVSAHADATKFVTATFGSATSGIEAETSTFKESDRTDASDTFSIAFGLKEQNVRIYADVAYNNSKVANQTTLTFNADYVYPIVNKFAVFGGAAIGHATLTWDEDNVENGALMGESDDSFVYGLKAGASYTVIKNADLELGYRYLSSDLKAEQDGLTLDVQDTASTYLGFTYSF